MSDFVVQDETLVKYKGKQRDLAPYLIVTKIGDEVFAESDITSISLKDCNRLTKIGAGAFKDCLSLVSVHLPYGLTEIEACTFSGCRALTSITIPRSVTTISYAAFFDCEQLTEILLPPEVTDIAYNAFEGCGNLTIYGEVGSAAEAFAKENEYPFVERQVSALQTEQGLYYNSADFVVLDGVLTQYLGAGGQVVVPDGVHEIANSVFASREDITSVVLPRGLVRIGRDAFEECTALSEINIPDTVTTIDESAFYRCLSLKQLILPDSVAEIGAAAFFECEQLSEVHLGAGLRGEMDFVFPFCSALTSIVIPEGVTAITDQCFHYAPLTSVSLPSTLERIGKEAFAGCEHLTTLTIPEGVTEIGNEAFAGCSELTALHIPASVRDIHKTACKAHHVDLTIYCPPKSKAAHFAKRYKIKFVEV